MCRSIAAGLLFCVVATKVDTKIHIYVNEAVKNNNIKGSNPVIPTPQSRSVERFFCMPVPKMKMTAYLVGIDSKNEILVVIATGISFLREALYIVHSSALLGAILITLFSIVTSLRNSTKNSTGT